MDESDAPRIYGVGVLGLGVIGRWVAQELQESDRFEIVAGYDPAPRKPSPYPMLASANDVAAHPDVSLLYIASPPRHHADGVAFAVANRKAILCEKPLAPTVETADRMAADVNAAGLPAVVNFAFPTIPAGRALVAAADRRQLGPVESAEIRIRIRAWPQTWHAEAGAWLTSPDEGGFTREVVTHFLALTDRLLGPAVLHRAEVERGADGLETRTRADISYGDVPLILDAALDPDVQSADDMTSRVVLRCQGGEMAIEDWTNAIGVPPAEDRPPGIADLLAARLDGKDVDLLNFDVAARVVHLIEAILAR